MRLGDFYSVSRYHDASVLQDPRRMVITRVACPCPEDPAMTPNCDRNGVVGVEGGDISQRHNGSKRRWS
jgi:hypothetical protein